LREAARNWIEFAKRDFSASKKLEEDEYLANICLFHCQQTIEKLFKAVLEENKIRIPKIHSITTLFEKLPDDLKIENFINIDELGLIDDIYIDARYPGEIGLIPGGFPTKNDTSEVLRITHKVYSAVIKYLDS